MKPDQVLFEFQRIGGYVKVSALDPESNTEVSIVGDANASVIYLKQTALRKLRYVLDRQSK